ncbi:antitoxin HicB [Brevibacterium casei]|uniref:antitoxin HicB n=1 Tax=Brevibacterium TaxID=1696 RepID=UPI0014316C39|nr:antitoxin HicB [Brevibacterium casei]MCT1766893.1 antitoxin HicB [Brevibacterium casei]NJE65491.1 antitoxin HicB [Brevibacterium sp. LS14]
MSTEHYAYRVQWSQKDQEHVGTVTEFPSLSWLDPDPCAAFDGVRNLVGEVLEDMDQAGDEQPPKRVR